MIGPAEGIQRDDAIGDIGVREIGGQVDGRGGAVLGHRNGRNGGRHGRRTIGAHRDRGHVGDGAVVVLDRVAEGVLTAKVRAGRVSHHAGGWIDADRAGAGVLRDRHRGWIEGAVGVRVVGKHVDRYRLIAVNHNHVAVGHRGRIDVDVDRGHVGDDAIVVLDGVSEAIQAGEVLNGRVGHQTRDRIDAGRAVARCMHDGHRGRINGAVGVGVVGENINDRRLVDVGRDAESLFATGGARSTT